MKATYFMFGKYTSTEAVREITAKRTQDAVGVIERFNGQIVSLYALLGQYDLVFIVNLPGNLEAMQVSIQLSQITGISFTTSPAITVERMDSLLEHIVQMKGSKPLDIPST